jgi:hypothetical protein
MTFEYRGRSVDIRDGSTKHQRCYDILVDGKQYAISYGHLPGRAIARAKRLIDAELDKNFGQKTVGSKGSEIDIRRCTKEDLDANSERPRAWKAGASPSKQRIKRASPKAPEQLELSITEEPIHEFPD